MKRFRWSIAVGALALLPLLASATPFTFQETETSALSPSPVSFTFSLDTSTASLTPTGSTVFNNVLIVENGTNIPGNTIGTEYGTDLFSPLFFWIDTSLTPFTSGSGSGITFNIGSFSLADGATDGEGTLQISSPVSPTPEPSTWILLLTGLATIALVRRSGWSPRSRTAA